MPFTHKRPAFQDDIVNEFDKELFEGERRSSIIQHHLKRKEKPAGEPLKKKKPRKLKNGQMSVLDQIEALEHQEQEDVSPERRGNSTVVFANFDFKKAQSKASPENQSENSLVKKTAKKPDHKESQISLDFKEALNDMSLNDLIRDFDDTGL